MAPLSCLCGALACGTAAAAADVAEEIVDGGIVENEATDPTVAGHGKAPGLEVGLPPAAEGGGGGGRSPLEPPPASPGAPSRDEGDGSVCRRTAR